MQHFTQFLTGTAHRAPNPNRSKVRRHSFAKGREGVFWRSMKRQDAKQIVLAAKRYERQTKGRGQRNGALGHIALEILDYLSNLVDYHTGRLEPSLDTMMQRLNRSRDAIVRALKALRSHGFIDWLRRYVPTGEEGFGKPKYHQTSNAYRLLMPSAALKALGRYGTKAPIPDDFAQAQQEQAENLKVMEDSLSREEFAQHIIEDTGLAASLARLGASLDKKKREYAKQSESQSKINYNGNMDRLAPDIK